MAELKAELENAEDESGAIDPQVAGEEERAPGAGRLVVTNASLARGAPPPQQLPGGEDPGHRPTQTNAGWWVDLGERAGLYLVGAGVLLGMSNAYASAVARTQAFQELLVAQLDDDRVPDLCAASVLLADHALSETAQLRLIQLILGAVLCVFGGLFVIKGIQASYSLDATGGTLKSVLTTSSPGLVLITLAVVLMGLATREPMKFEYRPPAQCLADAYRPDAGGGTVTSGEHPPPPADAEAIHLPPIDEMPTAAMEGPPE